MTGDPRKKRIADGSDLRDSIKALAKVPVSHRTEYLHDRVVAMVESVCCKENGKSIFTAQQIDAIKDITFFLIRMLELEEVEEKKAKGWLSRGYDEFREMPVFKQIAIIGGIAVFVLGPPSYLSETFRNVTGISAVIERYSKPASANTPSNTNAPGAPAPRP